MIRRRQALLGIPGLALLAGCAPGLRPGADDGGIGGTGLQALDPRPDEGGIGGTGIFGTVTALGSIEVNGLRLAVSDATRIEALARRVLPGDTVAAEARHGADGLTAERVAVFHPLVGPWGTVRDGLPTVLGTPVILAGDAPRRDAAGRPQADIRPGRTVAVSGLWRGEAVVATSLTVLDAAGPAIVRGLLRRRGEALVVGSTIVDLGRLPASLGRFVTLQGVAGPAGIAADRVDTAPLGVFSGRVAALAVEGFLAANFGAPGFHLAGFGLPLDPASPIRPRIGVRQLFLGRYRDGFDVRDGLALPATAAERALTLGEPSTGALIRAWLDER